KRAVIPDSENSGLVLLTAKARMPANWPFWDHPQAAGKGNRSEEELRALQEGLWNLQPCAQLTPRQAQALRTELRRAEAALGMARKVADLPRGRYVINYTRDYVSTLLPHVQDARIMGNLFAYDALLL